MNENNHKCNYYEEDHHTRYIPAHSSYDQVWGGLDNGKTYPYQKKNKELAVGETLVSRMTNEEHRTIGVCLKNHVVSSIMRLSRMKELTQQKA